MRIVGGPLRLHVGAPAVNGDDAPAFAQYRHGMPHRGVGDAVLFCEAPLAWELRRDLTLCDPPLNIVRYLDIGIFRPKGINRTSRHMITIRCSLSCQNTDELCELFRAISALLWLSAGSAGPFGRQNARSRGPAGLGPGVRL